MSVPDPKRATNCTNTHSGLPLHKFLSTLDWLKFSHPPSDFNSCAACSANRASSESQDVANPVDNLIGHLSFRIGYNDVLCFAPCHDQQHALSAIPATLSATDAKLRIVIHATANCPSRCFTANTRCIAEDPSLHNTENDWRLDVPFPFTTLIFHRSKQTADGVHSARSYGTKFTAMKDAIAELRTVPPAIDRIAAAEIGEKKDEHFVSLLDVQLANIAKKHNCDKTDAALSNFVWRAALMTVPHAFPYALVEGTQKENDERNQVALVDAFLEMQVAQRALLKQAQKCVAAATACHDSKESDTMLTREEIEGRRKK